MAKYQMGVTGLEHSAKTPEKTVNSNSGGAVGDQFNQIDLIGSDLQRIVGAWPSLPDVIKEGIKAMIDSASALQSLSRTLPNPIMRYWFLHKIRFGSS